MPPLVVYGIVLELLLDDVGHRQVLEDAAVGGARQEPEPGGHPGHVQVDVALAAGLEHRRVALSVFFEGRDEAVEITRRAARELERPRGGLAEDLLWLDVGAPRPEIELGSGESAAVL